MNTVGNSSRNAVQESVTAGAIEEQIRQFAKLADSLMRAMDAAVTAKDPHSLWVHSGYKQYARKYNALVDEVRKVVDLPPLLDWFDTEAIPGNMDSLPFQRKEIFDAVYANLSLLKATLESKLGAVASETEALRDFFQARLRSVIRSEPAKEVEVQDALESLLIGRGLQKGIDYDREVGRVKVSAKEVVPDFVMRRLSLAIEVKLIKSRSRISQAVDEINADARGYSKQYGNLLFVVYDLGHIRDEVEFKQGLEEAPKVAVVVVKH